MKTPKLFLTAALIVVTLNSCFISEADSSAEIEGFWISTKETSNNFGSAENAVLLIKNVGAEGLSARCCFIGNNEFKMECRFIDVRYDSIAKRISVIDSDSDTLILTYDAESEMLKGGIHSDEITPVNFVRAEKDFTNLFYPRKPERSGQITYRYQQPEQIENSLQTDDIFKYVKDSVAVYRFMERILEQKSGHLESLLIIKDGKLILEEYFFDYSRTKLHRINSCTKSITSLLLGITLDRHNIRQLCKLS